MAAPGSDRDDRDQVRNGNRWRVAGVDQGTNRLAAERLTDKARVVFNSDYLHENIHLGYAVTVHSAQGITAATAHAVIGESASRALAYVAMSRGRDTNRAYIYTRFSGEADHEHAASAAGVHVLRRGTKYSAAHCLRVILANDERPRTMHAEAERTGRELLPEFVGQLLDRHDSRRAARRRAWRRYSAAERAWHAAYERIADSADASPTPRNAAPRAAAAASKATDSNFRSPPRRERPLPRAQSNTTCARFSPRWASSREANSPEPCRNDPPTVSANRSSTSIGMPLSSA